MSKKRVSQEKLPAKNFSRVLTKRVTTLVFCVAVTVTALSRWEPVRRTLGLSPILSSAPQQTAGLNPTKEYIYVGGRLIATEEPEGATFPDSNCCRYPNGKRIPDCWCRNTSLTAPQNFSAATQSASQIVLTWGSSSGPVAYYQVERSQSIAGPYTALSPNAGETSFTDTTVGGGIAYLYRVRAVDAAGDFSDYSNVDLATAVTFSDNPLTAGITPVRAAHLTEMRQVVNAVRTTAGLPPANWTDTALVGVRIKAAHVQELRSNLDYALGALGLATSPYTDTALQGVPIKKIHIEELRNRVK
jgi:hypothetical protein